MRNNCCTTNDLPLYHVSLGYAHLSAGPLKDFKYSVSFPDCLMAQSQWGFMLWNSHAGSAGYFMAVAKNDMPVSCPP